MLLYCRKCCVVVETTLLTAFLHLSSSVVRTPPPFHSHGHNGSSHICPLRPTSWSQLIGSGMITWPRMNQSESFTGNLKVLALVYFLKEDSHILSGRLGGRQRWIIGQEGIERYGRTWRTKHSGRVLEATFILKKFFSCNAWQEDLSSPTRDEPMLPAVETRSLNHWATRFLLSFLNSKNS